MEYSNIDKLSAVITEWIRPSLSKIASSSLNKLEGVASANSWIIKYFPVKSDYSIVNDLGFLLSPVTTSIVKPMLSNAIAKLGITDNGIPEFARNVVKSALKEANEKGKITLFGILEIEPSDIKELKRLLEKNLSCDSEVGYSVVK